MPKDLVIRDNFGLLPEPEGRWGSFGVSMITNVVIMTLLLLFTAAIHKVEKVKYTGPLVIDLARSTASAAKVVVPKVKVFAPPQPKLEVVKLEPPKIVMPKIQPPPEIPKPVKLDAGSTQAASGAPEGGCAPATTEGRPVYQPETY